MVRYHRARHLLYPNTLNDALSGLLLRSLGESLTKREQILLDPDIKRWYNNLSGGSPITAEVRIRRLRMFCDQNNTTPKELVSLGRSNRKAVEDLLQDHVTRMEKRGNAPGYISGMVKAVKSWLDHNKVEMKLKIRISNFEASPTIEDERVPEKDELKTLFMYGNDRSKVDMAMISQAGLRPETLGNDSGTDGIFCNVALANRIRLYMETELYYDGFSLLSCLTESREMARFQIVISVGDNVSPTSGK